MRSYVLLILAFVVGSLGECTQASTAYTYSQVTGHFYTPVRCLNDTWEGAFAFAKTLAHPTFGPGYLWEINSFEERHSLQSSLLWPSNKDNFVGGKDATGSNNWYWTGPASSDNFYNPTNGCTDYCNFDLGYPTPSSSPQGLRIRLSAGPGWIAASTTEVVEEAWAFVEFGCCDCGNRGTCNQTTCQCDCGDNYIGPHCECYIGSCRYPDAPVCDPVTPVCVKPNPTSVPTDTPTDAPTDAPTEPPSCEVTVTPMQQNTYDVSGGSGADYAIVVANTGGQVAMRAYFDIIIPSSSYIVEWWNFSRLAPTFIDLPDLAPGNTYSLGGFRLEDYASSSTIVSFIYNSTVC